MTTADTGEPGVGHPTDQTDSNRTSDRAGGPLSARLALVVAVGFTALVAMLVDGLRPAAVGVIGAVATGWGVGTLAADGKRRVAAGSVATVLGSAAVFGAAALAVLADRNGYVLLVVGCVVVAIETWDGIDAEVGPRFRRCLSESGFVAVVAFVAFAVAFTLFGTGLAVAGIRRAFVAMTATPFAALFWLQVGILAIGLLVDRASRVVERWTDAEAVASDGLAARFRLTIHDVPRWYLAALAVQFVAASIVTGVVDPYLASRPLLDRAVTLVLLSGATHGALGAVLVALGCIAVMPRLRSSLVFWTGTSPGYTLAFAAGGLASVCVALLVGAVGALGLAGEALLPDIATNGVSGALGLAIPVLAGTFAAFLATAVVALWLWSAVEWVDLSAGGFAVGATVCFGGTLVLAARLPTLVVLTGAAVSLLVWDLGVHATGLDRDLPDLAPPARTEVVHAVAAGGALTVGVAVAAGVGYLAVPLRIPADRAVVALALAVASLVAFVYAVDR